MNRSSVGPRGVVVIGVFFTSLSSIFIRLSEAPPLAIAAWRMVFATVLLLPIFVVQQARKRSRVAHVTNSDRIPSLPVALALSVLSGIFLASHFAFWISSLSYTSIASSTVLVSTHPIIVAFLGFVVLGERVSLRAIVFIVLALGGSVLLVWGGIEGGGDASFGDLLALLGALMVGGYMLIGRVVRRRFGVNEYTMIVYAVAAVVLVGAAVVSGVPLVPYRAIDFVLFAALAVFCTLLGHSLYSWALKYVRPTFLSTTVLGEPVIAGLLAAALFGELPSATTLAGGAVILASIYLFVREEGRAARVIAKNASVGT